MSTVTAQVRPTRWSVPDLLSHLSSVTLNEVNLRGQSDTAFIVTSEPTVFQQAQALARLDLPPEPRFCNRLTM